MLTVSDNFPFPSEQTSGDHLVELLRIEVKVFMMETLVKQLATHSALSPIQEQYAVNAKHWGHDAVQVPCGTTIIVHNKVI